MRTIVYVDALNLYYRALKKKPECKWLNLEALFDRMLPSNEITAIKYYYAPVSGKFDQAAPNRQNAYIRALKTLSRVELYKGKFMANVVWAKMYPSKRHGHLILPEPPSWPEGYVPEAASVIKQEEKGSDVNLSVHLVRDALLNRFEAAAVLTEDTDMAEAMRIVRDDANLPVGLIKPSGRPVKTLEALASFVRHLEPEDLNQCQFPRFLKEGDIRRPETWVQEGEA